ncbi:MAG: hypothetical protein Q9217_001988 [Psora testacea]
MEHKPDLLYPERQSHHSSQQHLNLSQWSLSPKKSQKFLTSVKGLLHRSSRSVGDIRSSKSTQNLTITHRDRPSRSKSLDNIDKPLPWKQRGQTPGMDDYLTLAELETVWVTQDSYVGSIQAPQKSTRYTYVEPVEAPTIVKHQIQTEIRQQPLPKLRITTDSPSSQRTSHGEGSSEVDGMAPLALRLRTALSTPSSTLKTSAVRSSDPPPPPPPPPSVTDVRNAVVSGIIHPAFRPTPYFSENDTIPDCSMKRYDRGVKGLL